MTQIIFRTTQGVFTLNEVINFDPVEMPYLSLGYGWNGSSLAANDQLNLYWSFVDTFLSKYNLTKDDYITLETIIHNGQRFGI